MTEREREINFVLQMVQGILEQNELTLTTSSKGKEMVIIDDTTGKEYAILQHKRGVAQ